MRLFPIGAVLLAAALAGAPLGAQTLVAPEKNPPGDIPDNQAFVTFTSPGTSPAGYAIEVPEGWARSDLQDGVRFADKYGIVSVTLQPPDVAHEKATDILADMPGAKIVASGKAALAGGPALKIRYLANSAPNPVTGRIILLEHDRYVVPGRSATAIIDFAAPAGADNVDQWRLMSNSFRWK